MSALARAPRRRPRLPVLIAAALLAMGPNGNALPPGTDTPEPTIEPAPPDPVLVGAGDIASCESPGDEATPALIDQIPGTVFTAGDNAYVNGTAGEFAATATRSAAARQAHPRSGGCAPSCLPATLAARRPSPTGPASVPL